VFAVPLVFCALSTAMAAPFDRFKDCEACPEMIELPLGEFVMGAPEEERRKEYLWRDEQGSIASDPINLSREGPLHVVTVDVPIAMGRNEVTYDQWLFCVQDGACNEYIPDPTVLKLTVDRKVLPMQALGEHPVMRVSFKDALEYIEWLNIQVGTDVYRLPTEAEWEYAARAGTQTAFAQGDAVTQQQVNYSDQTRALELSKDQPGYVISSTPVPVGELTAANAWGLRHMSGNIAEVTMSCWSDRHELWATSSEYRQQALSTQLCERVVRGGSYRASRNNARVAYRRPVDENVRLSDRGFRVVREVLE